MKLQSKPQNNPNAHSNQMRLEFEESQKGNLYIDF
jgi:hypothetical protein